MRFECKHKIVYLIIALYLVVGVSLPSHASSLLGSGSLDGDFSVDASGSTPEDIGVNMDGLAFPSYTYDYWGFPIPCPDPYYVVKVVTGVDLGIGEFKKPNDLFTDSRGRLYLVASGDSREDNRIVIMDEDLKVQKIITSYKDDQGEDHNFVEPLGIYVTEEFEIYVADGLSKNIIHMDEDGNLLRLIKAPNKDDSAIISDNFTDRYRPSKLVVDTSGRIHVVAINVNEGIVEFDPDGEFEGFLAAGKVNANPIEVIWKKISTQEQLDRMADFVPIEYNNISLDKEDFVLATSAAIQESKVLSEIRSGKGTEEGALIRRINMLGKDILRRKGFGPPVGDYNIFDTINNIDASFQGISQFMDVSSGKNGVYSVLDNNRKRIFTYDSEGYLLYAFSGADVTSGGFRTPVALAEFEDKMYVLDSNTRSITMFNRTRFSRLIDEAIDQQEMGNYELSSAKWQEVLDMNSNYDLAYAGLGKASYRYGDYVEAMRLFKLANDRDWYSRAYKEHRKQLVAKGFATAIYILFFFILALYLLNRFVLKRRKERRSE